MFKLIARNKFAMCLIRFQFTLFHQYFTALYDQNWGTLVHSPLIHTIVNMEVLIFSLDGIRFLRVKDHNVSVRTPL